MTKARPTPGRRSAGPKTVYQHRVAHAPAQSKYTPHAGGKQLAKAERKAAEAQERYAKTRSHVALVRMKDAVTDALRRS